MTDEAAPTGRSSDESPGLLPRRLIFRDSERSVVRISADGTRIAFRAPVDGVLNLWAAPLDRIEEARPITTVTDRNLGHWIVWMRDNRHLVFFREAAGDENWRAWRADLETGDVRPLTPGPGVTCYIQQSSCHFPNELLISHNARDKRYFNVYRVNVATGESALVQLNEGFRHHFTDQQFQVRFAVRQTHDGDIEYLQRGLDGEWMPFSRIGAEDAVATRAIEFSATAANSIGSTVGVATPPPSSRKTSQAVLCEFSRKSACRFHPAFARSDQRAPGCSRAFDRARRLAGPGPGLFR